MKGPHLKGKRKKKQKKKQKKNGINPRIGENLKKDSKGMPKKQ